MSRPVQLRYNDVNNGETVIGTYLLDDNLIDGAVLKNSVGGEYTRLEIKGDKQLRSKLPINYNQYGTAKNGTDDPEILVYVRDIDTSSWQLRDRVFPDTSGSIQDQGEYRNKDLYGFQKFVGKQETGQISLSDVTVRDIVAQLLPTGYVAKNPDLDALNTIDNYSFNGIKNKALRDLIRDYPVFIFFTSQLDSNNDYIVRVVSENFFDGIAADVKYTENQRTKGYRLNSFEEEDKTSVINKVTVEGVDSNGDVVQFSSDDSNSIQKHGLRSVRRSVGYLESGAQATNLASIILSPEADSHAEVSVPFQQQNILNNSIDLKDTRFGIDAVFTVFQQKDFFTDSRTELELGFLKNSAEDRRDSDRDLDENSRQLFPSNNKGLQGQTGDTAPDVQGQTGDTSPNVAGSSDGDGGAAVVEEADESNTTTGADIGYSTGVSFFPEFVDTAGMMVNITFRNSSTSAEGMNIRIEDDTGTEFPSSNGVFSEIFLTNDNEVVGTATIFVPENTSFRNYEVQFELVNNNQSETGWFNSVEYYTIDQHSHGSGTYDADLHPHNDGNLDSDLHPHDNGSLEAEITEENKTDR